MGKSVWKDLFREIKRTFGRFIAIFAIVAIGVAFFAGVTASSNDMKNSTDHYYDDYNMSDLRLNCNKNICNYIFYLVYSKKHIKLIIPFRMEQQQAEQLIAIYCNKLPLEAINVIKEKILTMDYNTASIILAQAKDPTISILLSVLVGSLGIDRIYIGDTGLGIIKLLTCGGCGIWWLIDLFLIINATKQKNLQLLMGIYL